MKTGAVKCLNTLTSGRRNLMTGYRKLTMVFGWLMAAVAVSWGAAILNLFKELAR